MTHTRQVGELILLTCKCESHCIKFVDNFLKRFMTKVSDLHHIFLSLTDKILDSVDSCTLEAVEGTNRKVKLFDEISPKYAERNGGYCRITKLGPRRGDCAEMAIIELV